MSEVEGVVCEVAVRLFLGDVAQDVHVVGAVPEFPRFEQVARCEREADGERDAQPKVGRPEEKMVVAVDDR